MQKGIKTHKTHTKTAMNHYSLQFLKAGFSVFPIEYASKTPLVKWSLLQDHQAQLELVQRWFAQKTVNLGIITGYNNLLVLDFDTFTEYTRWLAWISRQPVYPLVRRAFAVRTSRGVHVYFRSAQPERNRHIDKIDVKACYGYVVGPESVHPSGAMYTPISRFYIPTISSLSDVLPAPLLLSKQSVSPVIAPLQMTIDDPWQSVQGGVSAPGEDLVTAIRRKFRIEQFFTTPLAKSGGHFEMTMCPFHDDQKASFWIDTQHQVCGCFTCNFGKPWDVINLYANLYGISNVEAIWAMSRML